MNKRIRALMLFVGTASLLSAGCGHKDAGSSGADSSSTTDKLPVVETTAARVGQITDSIQASGTLTPLPGHEAKIAPPFAGQLQGVYVQPNQDVARGQLVAQMSTASLEGQIQQAQATIAQNQLQVRQARLAALSQQSNTKTSIAQAEAQLAGDQAALRNATSAYNRQQRLFSDGLVAQKDVEDANAAVDSAQATVSAQQAAVDAAKASVLNDASKQQDIAIAQQQVLSAEGALRTLDAQVRLAAVHSPIPGRAVAVTAAAGETVDPSATIVTVVDTSRLQWIAQVPASSARRVHRGQAATFALDAFPGRVFHGTVASAGNQIDPSTGAIPVTVILRCDRSCKSIARRHDCDWPDRYWHTLRDPDPEASIDYGSELRPDERVRGGQHGRCTCPQCPSPSEW